MEETNGSSFYTCEQEIALGEAPCQNCGKMVAIMLPFIGCVFCEDCITSGDTGQYDGTEDFYDKRRERESYG